MSPVQSAPAQVQTIEGVWRSDPFSSYEDKRATIVHGAHITTPIPFPPPAVSTTSPHALREETYDAVDAFFGVTHLTRSTRVPGTRESRHDDIPPAYPYDSDLPEYSYWDKETGAKEPPTLAMYLFKYGFLFPLFWFIGSFILLTPLRAPEDWEPTKTMEERKEMITLMRKTEMKWAYRCLMASGALIALVLVVGLTVWGVLRSRGFP